MPEITPIQLTQVNEVKRRIYTVARDIFREKGYRKIRLETDATRQSRALAFYRRLGFYPIPHYGTDPDEISLEREL